MPLITISEDINKGTFTLFNNDKNQYIPSARNNINFSDDQVYDILGDNEYNKLHQKGKFDFNISNKKLY